MDPNQQPPQQPTITPQQNPPTDPLAGYGAVPQASSSGSYSPAPAASSPKKSKKLPFIIAGVVVGLLLITALIVVMTSGSKPVKTTPKANTSDNGGSSFLKPATAIGVEQTSNSVSQDLSGLNDDIDLPPTKIDDKALGL